MGAASVEESSKEVKREGEGKREKRLSAEIVWTAVPLDDR
jgi:hypothetical protein